MCDSEHQRLRERLTRFWDEEAERYGEYTRKYLQRNSWVADRLSELFPDAHNLRIADIGTGAGFLAVSYAQLGHTVTATDISERMLEEARANAKGLEGSIDFIIDDAEDTRLPEDSFDLVILRDVYGSFSDSLKTLDSLMGTVSPGGYLMISDGNYFLHRHDERYRARHVRYMTETNRSEYEAMLDMSHERAEELEEIIGDLEVNRHVRPSIDAEFAIQRGMNNIRIRCDDRNDFVQLSEFGKIRIPLRYTISFQKPYANTLTDGHSNTTPRSYTFLEKVNDPESVSAFFTTLANEDRIRILKELNRGPLNVSELSKRLEIPVKNVSYHLNLMKTAGILGTLKNGREVSYFQKDEAAIETLLHIASSLYNRR